MAKILKLDEKQVLITSARLMNEHLEQNSARLIGTQSQDGSWDSVSQTILGTEVMMYNASLERFEVGFALIPEDDIQFLPDDGAIRHENTEEMYLGNMTEADAALEIFNKTHNKVKGTVR